MRGRTMRYPGRFSTRLLQVPEASARNIVLRERVTFAITQDNNYDQRLQPTRAAVHSRPPKVVAELPGHDRATRPPRRPAAAAMTVTCPGKPPSFGKKIVGLNTNGGGEPATVIAARVTL